MNKIILKQQTKLVNKLIQLEEIEYSDIENLYDEETEEYQEIYIWYLIDNNYSDVFEELKIPLIEYEGQIWVGQTWYGASWKQSCYWKDLCEKLPFLKNE